MNKAKLKSYAPAARLDFIAVVTARANLLGLSENAGQLEVSPAQTQGDVTLISGQAWPSKVAAQREQLIVRMRRDGFAQTCEAVAYTWFNRFAALRYMELHDYLGHGYRALSSAEGGLPDILTYASDLARAGETGLPGLKAEIVTEMKLAGNRDGELYRMLLVAQCNALSRAMPFLFERIDDDSELLLPDNLLRSDSVIAKLVEEIPEEDWTQVEIIGWLYQFYISDKKDQVIGKVVKSADIPAATQLFTPNWIVQYLVQNSVGRLWMMANPKSTLAQDWPYYIQPTEQVSKSQAQLEALIQARVRVDGDTLSPESITVLDPACGSGHILVVAYDVLKSIYLERGYQPRSIPRLILEKNLFGIDIDDRAAQMAGFALIMKARADDRRLFSDPVNLNVLSLRESNGLDAGSLIQALRTNAEFTLALSDLGDVFNESNSRDLFPESHLQRSLGQSNSENTKNKDFETIITLLIKTFADAKTFGSLIVVPEQLCVKLLWLKEVMSLLVHDSVDLYAKSAAQDLMPLVTQAQILAMKFDAVVANPPYMGSKGMNPALKGFARAIFPDSKSDLFAMFMERGFGWCKKSGFNSMVTMQSWMFLSSYEAMREKILKNRTIETMAHLGARAFSEISGEIVQTTAFVLRGQNFTDFKPTFFRLIDGQELDKENALRLNQSRFNSTLQCDFNLVPGSPIAYWLSPKLRQSFVGSQKLSDISKTRVGMATGDNNKYVRFWWEVSRNNIGTNLNREGAKISRLKWFPFANGGETRKWFGNLEHIVNWNNDGQELQTALHESGRVRAHNFNLDLIFKPGITWPLISGNYFGARILPSGFLFSSGAPSLFAEEDDIPLILGLLNSCVAGALQKAINPTLNNNSGDTDKLPLKIGPENREKIVDVVLRLIELSKTSWDSNEFSWDFSAPRFFDIKELSLAESWRKWEILSKENLQNALALERENNCALIEAYGLEGEISPEVPGDQISLVRANREKDAQRLVSFAIGCMMGRYSFDEPGLIYANKGNIGFERARYDSFAVDADGIVPITDELWFENDVLTRLHQFLVKAWGADSLIQNLAWLAESLGSKVGETPDETIRRYLADKFYADHLQTYKKRPIYWLFSSGKQGAFQALVYLHRYQDGTLARIRAEYVVPLTSKIQSRIEMLEKDVNAASSTAARNKLAREVEKLKKKHIELLAYDEQLRHYADMRITLDLDDGVKVNYSKFGNLLADVKAIVGGTDDE